VCTVALGAACSHARQDEAALAAAKSRIRSALRSPRHPLVGSDKRARLAWDDTRQFYEHRDDAPVWSDGRKTNGRADELARAIREAGQDALDREILPKAGKDPDYLERNNIEYDESGQHYRQRPGKGNSLAGVKFLFPNHFNVYLHDTPSAHLFDRVERDFSHGCVRVEQPLALAKYVLRDKPEWTEDRIREAMTSGIEKSVPLGQPLPIYLVYFTAWDEGGRLRTVADVYGHDRRQHASSRASP